MLTASYLVQIALMVGLPERPTLISTARFLQR
jgi:hypothetical protein